MRRLGLPLAFMASILLILLHMMPTQPDDVDSWDAQATTYSYGPAGARALYMLLGQLGLRVERLRRMDYAALDADTVLWVLSEEPLSRFARAAALAYVQRGGTLVAPPRLVQDVLADADLGSPLTRARWHTEVLTLEGNALLELKQPAKALVGVQGEPSHVFAQTAGDAAPIVAAWSVGEGQVVSLGVLELVGNDGMGRGRNGVFVARLALALGKRHVFDEFKTGFGEGDLGSLLRRAPYRWGVLQAALVALVALWAAVVRRFPVRTEPGRRRRNTLDHVEAVAQLWASAQDAGLPLQALLAALQERARARLGGGGTGQAGEEEPLFVRWLAGVCPERRAEAASCWAQAEALMASARPPVDVARRLVAQLRAMEEEGMRW